MKIVSWVREPRHLALVVALAVIVGLVAFVRLSGIRFGPPPKPDPEVVKLQSLTDCEEILAKDRELTKRWEDSGRKDERALSLLSVVVFREQDLGCSEDIQSPSPGS